MAEYRVESDSMGEIKIPADAYYGAQTQRAVENFPVSGKPMPEEFIRALGIIKFASAEANMGLGLLKPKIGRAISHAAREVAKGKHYEQFVVDVYQTGSGTSTNMNANEVVANLAIEILGGTIGSKDPVHPNDHVNLCQSSNDAIPSAIHIAALDGIENRLLPALDLLQKALLKKAKKWDSIVKVGRTHLQDALPVRMGQEFGGYASQIDHGKRRMRSLKYHLRELPLGGTAIGTGFNSHRNFTPLVIDKISEYTNERYVPAKNHFEAIAACDAVVEASGQLKVVATSLMKIANDFRWMNSGPRCGLGEIRLPDLQPGSSIMPGKVNPVIPESVMMLCATVIGNDTAISIGGQHGNFELNTMMPMMADHLLESIRLLTNGSRLLAERCVEDMEVNEERITQLVEHSLALATALAPKIGYDAAAGIAKDALAEGKTIREIAHERKPLPEDELERALNTFKMTKPGFPS